jgi:hypothetical protein
VAKQLPKKDAAGIYQENGDFQKDIEINHLRNRYTLTKGAFQKMVGSTLCHALPTDTPSSLQLHYYNMLSCMATNNFVCPTL